VDRDLEAGIDLHVVQIDTTRIPAGSATTNTEKWCRDDWRFCSHGSDLQHQVRNAPDEAWRGPASSPGGSVSVCEREQLNDGRLAYSTRSQQNPALLGL